jgi:hypothetical protein
LYLTDAPVNHWQQTFSINSLSGDAMIINVNRSTIGKNEVSPLMNGANTPVYTGVTTSLTQGNDAVETFNVTLDADLALDANLRLSTFHAPIGDTVVVTSTLRNLGRGEATNPISVCFYSGVPTTGSQIGCDDLPAGTTLAYNSSVQLAFDIISDGTSQPIYAQVFSSGYNGNPANDIATGALGALPAPTLTSITEDKQFMVNALGIRWAPPLVPGVLGYRILRSTDSGASYELVGETSNAYLPDLLVSRGVSYCYVVQAYDSSGTLSGLSNQLCALAPLVKMFLPITTKQ